MKVAVVAAHPDDEILGCGGTMARLSREHEVHVLILGEGITSRFASRADGPAADLDQLKDDAARAVKTVGASTLHFGGLPDNRFDQLPLLGTIKIVEEWLGSMGPDVVYTHHPGDLNVDHGVTFRAVLTATRPQAGHPVREVLSFEVASSTEWAFHRLEPVFRPSVFVDISATIEAKVAAMEQYRSEARAFPHPRSGEALRAIARRWGSVVGTEYAEAFELIRSVR